MVEFNTFYLPKQQRKSLSISYTIHTRSPCPYLNQEYAAKKSLPVLRTIKNSNTAF